jgi:hypothetical protein
MQNTDTKKNKKWAAVFPLLILNLLVTLSVIIYLAVTAINHTDTDSELFYNSTENEQYVLYIGLNDKDIYEQIIPMENIVKTINTICIKYASGYTMNKMKGGWIDDKGVLTQEDTLVYIFTGIDETAVISIMDEILTALNQNSILIEKRSVLSTFYSGKR